MECKHCGKEIPDGSVFCPNCGQEINPKKTCPKCKRKVDADVEFCMYCGARMDGKKVCPTCGEVIEGNFCGKCGTAIAPEKPAEQPSISQPTVEKAQVAPAKKPKKTIVVSPMLKKYRSVSYILAPALLLTVVVLLFLSSFAISIMHPEHAEVITWDYFFTDAWREIIDAKDQIASLKDSVGYGDYYEYLSRADNMITTRGIFPLLYVNAFLIGNFITTLVCVIKGSISFGKGVKKGENTELGGYAAASFASFMMACLSVLSFNYNSYEYYGYGASTTIVSVELNTLSVVAIIVALVLIVSAAILLYVAKGKPALNPIKIVGAVLSLIGLALSFMLTYMFATEAFGYNNGDSIQTMSALGWLQSAPFDLSGNDSTASSISAASGFFAFFYVINLMLSALTIKQFIQSLTTSFEGVQGGMSLSISTAVITTICMFFSMGIESDMISRGAVNFTAESVISTLTIALVLMGVAIATNIVGQKAAYQDSEDRLAEI